MKFIALIDKDTFKVTTFRHDDPGPLPPVIPPPEPEAEQDTEPPKPAPKPS